MKNSKGHARLRRLETWLRKVIKCFQDNDARPKLEFGNLSDLSAPTQFSGIAIRDKDFYRVALLVTHLANRPNGQVIVVSVPSLADLANFAPAADALFGTTDLRHEYQELIEKWGDPQRGIGENQCIALADWIRREVTMQPPAPGAAANSRMMIQTLPQAAAWRLTCRGKLQEPLDFIATLGSPRPGKASSKKSRRAPTVAAPAAKVAGVGAYNEPMVWFGQPPFPSAADVILGRPKFIHDDPRVATGCVDGVQAYVYRSGLTVMLTVDRSAARSRLNQFFAVLSRSGVPALSLPDSELVQISDLDAESGAVRASNMTVTRRNRLGGPPSESSITDESFVVKESVASEALLVADNCASDLRLREFSLRSFDAVTLATRESYTEAFVVGWSVIESHLQSVFNETWAAVGLSNNRIKEMEGDWTASHNIDLLLAVGRVTPKDAADLHRLRKKRNKIVHDLHEAAKEDAERCLERAAELVQLPSLSAVDVKVARI